MKTIEEVLGYITACYAFLNIKTFNKMPMSSKIKIKITTRKIVYSALFLVFFVLLPGLVFVSCSYSGRASLKLLNKAAQQRYDVIIVPGVPFEGKEWSRIMEARVYWSKYLFDQGIASNIIYSGSSVYSPYYEAEIMALYAKELGIPDSCIFTEIKAEHSTENVYYGYKLAQNMGFETVALASDPFQSKLLTGFIKKKVDRSVGVIPIVWDTVQMVEQKVTTLKIDPSSAFNASYVSIKERETIWKRLKGTRGKNIDTTAYSLVVASPH